MSSPSASLYGIGASSIPIGSLGLTPVVATRDPASTDVRGAFGEYPIGQLWINSSTNSSFVLTSIGASLGAISATWVTTGGGSVGVSTLTGNSGGAISPAAGNINIVGAAGTLVAGSGSTLTITAAPQTFTWNNNATSAALVVNNGYIVTAGAQSFSLPATSAVGDEVALMLNGGTSWTITQGAGQRQRVLANQSTAGVGGSVATTGQGQTIWLICTTASLEWQALAFSGALNVV